VSGQAGSSSLAANLALGALGGCAGTAAVLYGAGSSTAFLTGAAQPSVGIAGALGVLSHPLEPGLPLHVSGLNPVAYWAVVALFLAVVAGAGWWTWRLSRVLRARARADPRRLPGTATTDEITRAASARALQRRGATLRPSLEHARAREVGYLLGRARGKEVWASVEDSILVLGPPRSGKGLYLVINAILDAPGAVITTSTRPDNLTATLRARQRRGPVAVFDPQQLAPGVPAGLRWSLVRGCETPLTSMIRATALAASTGLGGGGTDNGGFWEGKTRVAIQALLHAAALDGRDARSLYRWSLDPALATDAVRILQTDAGAADGWAESLDAMVNADPRTRDSIWQGVSLAFTALADPRVLASVTPKDDERFSPVDFLNESGTLYLLATAAGAGSSAALVGALIEDVVETARTLAAASPGARLDPPVLAALDEIGNLAPLPSLPVLMAEGGGTGITTMPVLQSLAQARQKWGEHAATTIWDASIVKVILGGGSNTRDLQDLSALIGDREDRTESTTFGESGARTVQQSFRRVPVMPLARIRSLPFGTGAILLRTAPPIITELRAWTTRTT
jgi:type IV secretion system protein VirD4